MTKQISLYNHKLDKTERGPTTLDSFLDSIKDGKWQDAVLAVRIAKDETEKDTAKGKLPMVTVSGHFKDKDRTVTGLIEHSGFIAVDIDNLSKEEIDTVRAKLEGDIYTYAMFVSCSGKGMCVIVKIDGARHQDAFDGLSEYYYKNYDVVIDPACRNVNRTRFVSYDPQCEIFIASKVFKNYPKKQNPPQTNNIYFGKSDLDFVWKQIQDNRTDITGGYQQWLQITFGIADEYGEGGRSLFHTISQNSALYDYNKAEKQYNVCLKNKSNSGKKSTIKSVLYYAKQAGINISSPKTNIIVQASKMGKNGSCTPQQTINILKEIEGISEDESEQIVKQVYADSEAKDQEHKSSRLQLALYFKQYQSNIYKNELNLSVYRKKENQYIRMTEEDVNEIVWDASEKMNTDVQKEYVNEFLRGSRVATFHPLRDFFNDLAPANSLSNFEKLAKSLRSTQDIEYVQHLLAVWLTGCVGSVYGKINPMMLVLVGEQFTGKSSFFFNLLPNIACKEELVIGHIFQKNRNYNDELIQTSTFITVDEEFTSLENMGYKQMKAMITNPSIWIRLAYEKWGNQRHRLCNFAACSNESEILEDTTGNRRFGIIELGSEGIDFELYNSIDKTELWREIKQLYDSHNLKDLFSRKNFEGISEQNENFRKLAPEEELILQFFEKCKPDEGEFWTATKITDTLMYKSSFRNLKPKTVTQCLKKLGFDNNNGKTLRNGDKISRGFWIIPPKT
jgi:predicted P-loop ATPase